MPASLRESVVKLFFDLLVVGTIIDGIVALTREDRRALHDLMVGTEVVSPPADRAQGPLERSTGTPTR